MAATTKKWLVVIAAPAASAITASASTDNGTARTATGLTGNFSTLTTPAAVAAKMPVASPWNTAANIEAVSLVAMGTTVSALVFRTVAKPTSDTLTGLSLTVGGTVYTASVSALTAFQDAGLDADAMLAGVTGLLSALSTVNNTPGV